MLTLTVSSVQDAFAKADVKAAEERAGESRNRRRRLPLPVAERLVAALTTVAFGLRCAMLVEGGSCVDTGTAVALVLELPRLAEHISVLRLTEDGGDDMVGNAFFVNRRLLGERLKSLEGASGRIEQAGSRKDLDFLLINVERALGAPVNDTVRLGTAFATEVGYLFARSSGASTGDIALPTPGDPTALAGWLLEYPSVYVNSTAAGNCLSMVPLRVYEICLGTHQPPLATADDDAMKANHCLCQFSFSVPDTLAEMAAALVTAFVKVLEARVAGVDDSRRGVRMTERVTTLPQVAL
ncbi:unnamed protein product [Phaeothamnion confervicola]